jgi:hypothetical protein
MVHRYEKRYHKHSEGVSPGKFFVELKTFIFIYCGAQRPWVT